MTSATTALRPRRPGWNGAGQDGR